MRFIDCSDVCIAESDFAVYHKLNRSVKKSRPLRMLKFLLILSLVLGAAAGIYWYCYNAFLPF